MAPEPEGAPPTVRAPTLEDELGVRFGRPELLHEAMAHRSWCAETPGSASNERLEFLGDAVLGVAVADHCFRRFPGLAEGSLAKVRAAVVNTAVLAEVAGGIGLGRFLLLGRGEDASGGREKPSILADALEAVIGALYLDQGWERAHEIVVGLLEHRIEVAAAGPGAGDFKTRLQELAVQRTGQLPRYDVRGTGPDHDRRYRADVWIGGVLQGTGEGRSKKDAEQHAARAAWEVLEAGVVAGSSAGDLDAAGGPPERESVPDRGGDA